MHTGFQITIYMSLIQQNYDHLSIKKTKKQPKAASLDTPTFVSRDQCATTAPPKLVESEEILLSDKLRAAEHVWTWEVFESDESVRFGRFNLELV